MQPYVEILRRGGVVACPTETQMGLLADALNPEAVERVRDLKGRAAGEPISVIVPSLEAAVAIARDLSASAARLASRHWPGPLTLIMRAGGRLPDALKKHGNVAVRVPGPSPALDLVTAFGGPLTATSANPTGQPPLGDEAGLRAAFGDGLDAIVPGPVQGRQASTIVDVTGEQPVVLRQGPIRIDG
jgi:tRNA threonylcarbamoyl adenosine modification protein (Sua5/YciO/YrdC/YwlC family)